MYARDSDTSTLHVTLLFVHGGKVNPSFAELFTFEFAPDMKQTVTTAQSSAENGKPESPKQKELS